MLRYIHSLFPLKHNKIKLTPLNNYMYAMHHFYNSQVYTASPSGTNGKLDGVYVLYQCLLSSHWTIVTLGRGFQ